MKSRTVTKAVFLLATAMLTLTVARTQTCPTSGTVTLNTYPNTYYPGTQATVSAGATSIVIGNASTSGYGTTPISAYDIAGNMEYAVATAAVPLTGGTLTVQSGLKNSYKNANFGTNGQYRYQVIRIPVYYNLTIGAAIRPPEWNGTVGGVIDFYVSQTLNMNGYTIDASSGGFRGGGGGNSWSSDLAVGGRSGALFAQQSPSRLVMGGAAGTTAGAAGISSQSIGIAQAPVFPIICNGVLALKNLSASATDKNGNVVVGWQVSGGEDVQEYEVERSIDSANFSTIATFVPRSSPDNTDDYSYTDILAEDAPELVYYRIRERDINGNLLYSNIVAIEHPGVLSDLAVAPNPTSGNATVRFWNDNNAVIPIYLFDLTGHPVWCKQYEAMPGMNMSLDHLQQLPTGIYVLRFSTAKSNFVSRLSIFH